MDTDLEQAVRSEAYLEETPIFLNSNTKPAASRFEFEFRTPASDRQIIPESPSTANNHVRYVDVMLLPVSLCSL
jgi:hypothetical protein